MSRDLPLTPSGGSEDSDSDLVKTRRNVICPHCLERFSVLFGFSVRDVECAVVGAEAGLTKDELWRQSLSQAQIGLLDSARRSGLLDSFIAALERGPHNGLPSNKEKFFLHWLKMAKPRIIPDFALSEFRSLYPKAEIGFYVSQYVGAVTANGELNLFLPVDLVVGKSLVLAGVERKISADPAGVRQWLKTKMGYVPQEARIMLAEAHKRSIGEYARPVI